jgi:serine/threonine protein kinase
LTDSGTVHRPAGESPHVLEGEFPVRDGRRLPFAPQTRACPRAPIPSSPQPNTSENSAGLARTGSSDCWVKAGWGSSSGPRMMGSRRPVALKVMRPEVAAEATAKERFLREGRAAAAIQSDHVITIYQVGEANGVPFLAMQYLDGLNLDQWLKNWQKTKNRPVQASAVVRVAKDLLKGLVAAHEKGLIHRDIKPANLWVEAKTSRIKLLDFGLAKADGSDKGLTHSGQVLGTAAYMAPEQARGLHVDARADLFSVGVVLYRMIAGQSPFQQSTYNATIIAIVTEEPPPAASFGVVPDDLAELIDRLLAKSPEGRPASAKAALAVVLEVEQQLRGQAPASPVVAPAPVAPPPVSPVVAEVPIAPVLPPPLRSAPIPEPNADVIEIVYSTAEATLRPTPTRPVTPVPAPAPPPRSRIKRPRIKRPRIKRPRIKRPRIKRPWRIKGLRIKRPRCRRLRRAEQRKSRWRRRQQSTIVTIRKSLSSSPGARRS